MKNHYRGEMSKGRERETDGMTGMGKLFFKTQFSFEHTYM